MSLKMKEIKREIIDFLKEKNFNYTSKNVEMFLELYLEKNTDKEK